MAGSSGFHWARAARRAGLTTRRQLATDALDNIRFRLKGSTDEATREVRERVGAFLENQLEGRSWCVGERYSVADIYLYMLVGWQSYIKGGYELGGERVREHYERVGARPAVVRSRRLDDLDERQLRYHPELRAGRPIS